MRLLEIIVNLVLVKIDYYFLDNIWATYFDEQS